MSSPRIDEQKEASSRKILYLHISANRVRHHKLDLSHKHYISGNSFQNKRIAFELLTAEDPQWLIFKETDSKDLSKDPTLTVELSLDSNHVIKKVEDCFYYKSEYYRFTDDFIKNNALATLSINDIVSCRYISDHNIGLRAFLQAEPAELNDRLFSLIKYDIGYTSRLPILIIQLLEDLYNTMEKMRKEPFQNRLPPIEKAFSSIKEEMQKALAAPELIDVRRHTFLLFMENLEEIEKAIQNRLASIPTLREFTFKTPPFFVPPPNLHRQASDLYAPFEAKLDPADEKAPAQNKKTFIESVKLFFKNSKQKIFPDNQIHGLIKEEVDLKQFPKSHGLTLTKSDNLILGDLHGNAIKFLYFMIRENILTDITSNDYEKFINLYLKKADALTEQDLREFNEIIAKLKAVNPDNSPLITLIGDVLADRGSNDYFTLRLLQQLHTLHVPVKILVSNHDREFIGAYEKNELHEPETNPHLEVPYSLEIAPFQALSLIYLGTLFKKNLLKPADVVELVEKYYLPLLTGMEYTVNEAEKEITFMTHAPVGLSIIKKLATELGISFSDDDLTIPTKTAALVATINACVEYHIANKTFHQSSPAEESVLYKLLWHRAYLEDERNEDLLPPGWKIRYIHGHDGAGNTPILMSDSKQIINLDNALGKEKENMKGTYTAYYIGDNPHFLMVRNNFKSSTAMMYQMGLPPSSPIIFPEEGKDQEHPILSTDEPTLSDVMARVIAQAKADYQEIISKPCQSGPK